MRARSTSAVAIFVGALLIVIFFVGLTCSNNPGTFQRQYRYDYALEQFCSFCVNWWIPAGIIGFPLFLINLIIALVKESKEDRNRDSE